MCDRRLEMSPATDKAFDIVDRSFGILSRLVLSSFADETLLVRKSDVRWRDAISQVVRNNLHSAVFEHPDARVRRAQVDADHRSEFLLLRRRRRGRRGECRADEDEAITTTERTYTSTTTVLRHKHTESILTQRRSRPCHGFLLSRAQSSWSKVEEQKIRERTRNDAFVRSAVKEVMCPFTGQVSADV